MRGQALPHVSGFPAPQALWLPLVAITWSECERGEPSASRRDEPRKTEIQILSIAYGRQCIHADV